MKTLIYEILTKEQITAVEKEHEIDLSLDGVMK